MKRFGLALAVLDLFVFLFGFSSVFLCGCIVSLVVCVRSSEEERRYEQSAQEGGPRRVELEPEGGVPPKGGGPQFRVFFCHPPPLLFLLFLEVHWNCGRGSLPWPTHKPGFL